MKKCRRHISLLLLLLFSIGFFPHTVMATPQATKPEKQVVGLEMVENPPDEVYRSVVEGISRFKPLEDPVISSDEELELKGYKGIIADEITPQSRTEIEVIEYEYNDTIGYADVISDFISPAYSYLIYGQMNDTYDVDFFRFTLTERGMITAIGLWVGNYFELGWEDDLYVVIADAAGEIIHVLNYYQFDDFTAARYWEGVMNTGTYYLGVAANDEFGSLYVDEIYGLNLLFDALDPVTYTVSFNSNGGSSVSPVSTAPGGKINAPSAPLRDGYTFGGWYKDPQLTMPWNFSTDVVNQDTVLHAKWNTAMYQVVFEANGGTSVPSQTIPYGGAVSKPVAISRTGYTFGGWFRDRNLTDPFDFTYDRIYENTVLYAKWQANQLEVRFETFGGTVIDARTQSYDSLIIKPADPTLAGYHFSGWYLEDTYITPWVFTSMRVKESMTLYARWIRSDVYDVVAGANRYYTAAEISKSTFDEADTVILASGMNYPDALAGGPLAYLLNAPILLTQQSRIPKGTMDEIMRLSPGKVIILGSESAVSREVSDTLTNLGISVERLEGASRYTTAVEVARRVQSLSGKSTRAVLASGMDFADALSAGSYAAMEGIPILLTRSDRLMDSLAEALTDLGIEEVILIGGTSAVSPVVEDAVKDLGIGVTRYSGVNRYLTATVIADAFYRDATEAVIANGMTFPDALAAVPMAAGMGAPIILTGNGRVSASVLSYIGASDLQHVRFVGGESVIPESVRTKIAQEIQ